MSSENIITEGLGLMLLGMGTVFVFLTILVFVTGLMSSLVQKYVPETAALPAKKSLAGQDQQTLLAVITAAIHVHRANKKIN